MIMLSKNIFRVQNFWATNRVATFQTVGYGTLKLYSFVGVGIFEMQTSKCTENLKLKLSILFPKNIYN